MKVGPLLPSERGPTIESSRQLRPTESNGKQTPTVQHDAMDKDGAKNFITPESTATVKINRVQHHSFSLPESFICGVPGHVQVQREMES